MTKTLAISGCLLLIALLFPTFVVGGESEAIQLPAFGPAHAGNATKISMAGPSIVNPTYGATFELIGTPTVDIEEKGTSLMEKAPWAFNPKERLFAYLFSVTGEQIPLDIKLAFVISVDGPTFRPEIPIRAGTELAPGSWLVIVDWNFEQNQLVSHSFKVEGDQDEDNDGDNDGDEEDEDDEENPILPPLKNLYIGILIEKTDQSKDNPVTEVSEGVYLFQHLAAVKKYLTNLNVFWTTIENDQETESEWKDWTSHLPTNAKLPSMVLLDDRNQTVVAVLEFGVSEYATVNRLKELGVK